MAEYISIFQTAVPVVAVVISALTTLHLVGKPVHLDQYDAIKVVEEAATAEEEARLVAGQQPHQDAETTVNQIQTQFQHQRSTGLGKGLSRLGLVGLQAAIALLGIFIVLLDLDSAIDLPTYVVRFFALSFAVTLALFYTMRPEKALALWIRPQLDLLNLVQVLLVGLELYLIPWMQISQWPLWYSLEVTSFVASIGLMWVTIMTRPFQPVEAIKKPRENSARAPSKEFASSLYSQLTFSWVNSLIYLGYKRPVQDEDLPDIEILDYSVYSLYRYQEVKGESKTLFRALVKVLRGEFLAQLAWSLPWCAFVNSSPYCLNKIIRYLEEPNGAVENAYFYVFALLFASFAESLCMQAALHIGRRIYVHVASIVNNEVFAKTLRRKDMSSAPSEESGEKDKKKKDKEGSSNVSNLVAVDVRKLEVPFSYIFYLYGYPIQFVIASFQLYWLLDKAALVGIAFMIITYPIPAKLYSLVISLFKDIMSTKDERMDALNEMLSAIRIVKFFGWESKFEKKVIEARNKELKQIKETYIRFVVTDVIWMIVPLANIVVLLFTYTKLFGNEITAAKIFTTLSLFNLMRQALNMLPWQIKNTMAASVSLKRLDDYLKGEDLVRDATITKVDGKARVDAKEPTIGFVNASFKWPNKEVEQAKGPTAPTKKPFLQRLKAKFVKSPAADTIPETSSKPESVQERFKLQNLNASFPVGKLSVIVGATGSGKSALLLALLGELDRVQGSFYMPRLDYDPANKHRGSGLAYVAQTAWLQNKTIRENILFGRPYDEELYNAVVEGCALATDFEILESGDMTEIGEQGITLSGGQKQRVSLARAIYSHAKILLLDDCLSAVDAHTGKHLFQTLTGPLLANRTVLLVTHQVQLTLSSAHFVVVMDKGEIVGSGTPAEAVNKGWIENAILTKAGVDSEVSTLNGENGQPDNNGASSNDNNKKKDKKEKAAGKLTEDEKKAEGAVEWRVYMTYINASGGWLFWTGLIVMFLLREVIEIGQNGWLAHWSDKTASNTGSVAIKTFNYLMPEPVSDALYKAFIPKNGGDYYLTTAFFARGDGSKDIAYYLGIYILIAVVSLLFGALTNYYTIFGGLRASRVLHEKLLHKVSRAKVRFFDTTPIGRIINRFSSDMSTIDDEVSNGLQMFFNSFVIIIGIIVIISYKMPLFLIPALIIASVYGVIGALYVPISRDLKRLNSNSRSPILIHFNESLKGLTTIRAFGFQERFLNKSLVNQDNNNRTFFLLWSTNRWLHWRVDIAGAMVAFATGTLLLQSDIGPGWGGMALSYALMFNGTVVWLIRNYAQNEMNLNSVERVAEYLDLEEEPPAIIEGHRPPASWPHAGEIVVNNLNMKYAPDTPSVIKNISFHVKAGERVGIVGRTGSGKSTLAISLFRFMDPVEGSITIDGIDITTIGLYDLRSRLTIIPQDPVLFRGTLRSNLDPFGEHEDYELWEALRRSHLVPSSVPGSCTASSRNSVADLAFTPAKSPAGSVKGGSEGNSSSSSADATTAAPSVDVSEVAETVDPSKITLDTPVKENGSNFSQGQRQLIALARALVRRSHILVLDEATSSIDVQTDNKIQTTIREEFKQSTLLCIAHRLRTIADYDKVLVMDAGVIAEYDRPLNLMRKEGGVFRSMCERSSEIDELLAIAEAAELKRSRDSF
ncbi:hypothetical protein DFQ26_003118 [Actinomortierella ambigua]|nr:hypothetical protein DFQ26_003118 [Actinomortierella ambigua]